MSYSTKSTGAHRFQTNDLSQEQFRVSHTASAVNYVQATGSATGFSYSVGPVISAQGSDADVPPVSYTHLTLPTNREV